MSQVPPSPDDAGDDDALARILAGTSPTTGQEFFRALVQNLALVSGVAGAWVTEYFPESQRLRALAFWMNGEWIEGFEYCIRGTPCEPVISECREVYVPARIIELYPGDNSLEELRAVSYIGTPLLGDGGAVAGHLALLDTRPMPDPLRPRTLLGIFAARAMAELRRVRAEQVLREREMQLRRLFDGAMDAIIELDQELRVTAANAAAVAMLGLSSQRPAATVEDLFAGPSVRELLEWIRRLEAGTAGDEMRRVWVPQALQARRGDASFPAEATLSFRQVGGQRYYTLICRNINDRVQAEERIAALTDEAQRLREQLAAVAQGEAGELLGNSHAMKRVRQDIQQVAGTDATVLILGETGTGKELVAQALHRGSSRSGKPLVKVNCAAIPPTLIESEFFGHEKGAFTGATQKRVGRFALADRGTIFLDEIGELPLDLQGKLLRVLQEGEFEPVGSSRTHKCDVRVIAATNRQIATAVEAGRFRQDLYYRLNVYPIHLPPLRERGDDVLLLARAFAQRIGQRLGRTVEPPPDEAGHCLRAYAWSGNVRELENVIERAIITSPDGHLDLERALSQSAPAAVDPSTLEADTVLTAAQLQDLERQNLLRALARASGRVSGRGGAAELLGIPPSTLNSRMKALGIQRPQPTAG